MQFSTVTFSLIALLASFTVASPIAQDKVQVTKTLEARDFAIGTISPQPNPDLGPASVFPEPAEPEFKEETWVKPIVQFGKGEEYI